jgi:8-oxo-dGTP diphosphatase
MRVVLVRHGAAGDRASWGGDDRLRPLDALGRRQAAALPRALAGLRVSRIATSPYVRCGQTVEPLAAELGIGLEQVESLAEGAARADVLGLLGTGAAGMLLCTHGDVCRELVGPRRTPKGSAWVLDIGPSGVAVERHIPVLG